MTAARPTRQLVVLALAGEEYALPVERVHEIVRATRPRPVAGASPSLRGIISLRGRLVPVHDLAARLGLQPGAEPGRIVIADAPTGPTGLAVEEVREVLAAREEQFVAPPADADPMLTAVFRDGDRIIGVLDVEEMAA